MKSITKLNCVLVLSTWSFSGRSLLDWIILTGCRPFSSTEVHDPFTWKSSSLSSSSSPLSTSSSLRPVHLEVPIEHDLVGTRRVSHLQHSFCNYDFDFEFITLTISSQGRVRLVPTRTVWLPGWPFMIEGFSG